MIPDFPSVKGEMMKVFTYRIQRRHKEHLGFFAGIPAFSHQEGDRWRMIREDGTVVEDTYDEMSSAFQVHVDEVLGMTPEDLITKVDEISADLSDQMRKKIFGDIDKLAVESGRGIDAKGRPFNQELFLQLFESVQIDFDEDGNMVAPALVMHPNMWVANEEKMKSWEKDSEFVKKLELLELQKKEEWRARESRRKLVY